MRTASLDEGEQEIISFAQELLAPLPRRDQRIQGANYLRGLLGPVQPKNVSSIASYLGVDAQALHHFVSISPWDWRPVLRRVSARLADAARPVAWVVGDARFPTKGRGSAGAHRSYIPESGTVVSQQLGVCVHAVGRSGFCPVNWRLFLPRSWDADDGRRGATGVPARVRYRPRWQLALDLLDELTAWHGQRLPVVATGWYALAPELGDGLRARGLQLPAGDPGEAPRVAGRTPATAIARDPELPIRELSGPLGLRDYNGRSFAGWHHHVTLVSAACLFRVVREARRA